jgi:hypothetical protein
MNIYTWTKDNNYLIAIAPTLDIAMDGIKDKIVGAADIYNIMDYKVSKIPSPTKYKEWRPIIISNNISPDDAITSAGNVEASPINNKTTILPEDISQEAITSYNIPEVDIL